MSQIHIEILRLREHEKKISAEILEKLQLMENKRLYLPLGYSSLFDYLTRGLGYSASRAYERQSCLRLTKEIPELKTKIREGKINYTTLSRAFKTLKEKPTPEKRKILKSLENRSTREVERLLAMPAKKVQIKKTVYQEKVVLRLEISHELSNKIEKLKALRSHQGGLEKLLESMINKELQAYELKGFKKTRSKSPRHIPKRLENELLQAASYRCQYPGCEATHFLQVDHIVPVRVGGGNEVSNLQILCSAHNRWKG